MTLLRTGRSILLPPGIGARFRHFLFSALAILLLAVACLDDAGPAAAQDSPPAPLQTAAPAAPATAGSETESRPSTDPRADPRADPSAETGVDASDNPTIGTAVGDTVADDTAAEEPIIGQPVVETDAAAVAPAAERNAALPHDLSPIGMFLAADWVVKAVMLGLAFASLVTWTILVAKSLEILFAKRRAAASVARLARAETLSDALAAGKRRWRGPVAMLATSADAERTRSEALSGEGIKERVSVALSRIEAGAGRTISRGTGLLATIGSTAPFVGLFGTVWGIMNAFIGISQANTTNLAVVAPGIAEALLATAIGLVAAIPAVIVYNVFARSIAGYRAILSDGSALVLQHLSRDLDRRDVPLRAPVPMAQAAE